MTSIPQQANFNIHHPKRICSGAQFGKRAFISFEIDDRNLFGICVLELGIFFFSFFF